MTPADQQANQCKVTHNTRIAVWNKNRPAQMYKYQTVVQTYRCETVLKYHTIKDITKTKVKVSLKPFVILKGWRNTFKISHTENERKTKNRKSKSLWRGWLFEVHFVSIIKSCMWHRCRLRTLRADDTLARETRLTYRFGAKCPRDTGCHRSQKEIVKKGNSVKKSWEQSVQHRLTTGRVLSLWV